jgi:hypothetical protein
MAEEGCGVFAPDGLLRRDFAGMPIPFAEDLYNVVGGEIVFDGWRGFLIWHWWRHWHRR